MIQDGLYWTDNMCSDIWRSRPMSMSLVIQFSKSYLQKYGRNHWAGNRPVPEPELYTASGTRRTEVIFREAEDSIVVLLLKEAFFLWKYSYCKISKKKYKLSIIFHVDIFIISKKFKVHLQT
jgi:hypothetical protein